MNKKYFVLIIFVILNFYFLILPVEALSCYPGDTIITEMNPYSDEYLCCCDGSSWGGNRYNCITLSVGTPCESTTDTTIISTTTTTLPIISDICPYGTASTISGLICETDETAQPFDYYPIDSTTPITCYYCVQTSIGDCEDSDRGLDLEAVNSQCSDADGLHPDASEKRCDTDDKCKTAVPIIKNVYIVSSVGTGAPTDQNKIVEFNDDVYLYAIVQDTNCNTYLDYSSSSEIEASNYPDPQSISLDNRDVMPQLWNDEEWGELTFNWYRIMPVEWSWNKIGESTTSSNFWGIIEYSNTMLPDFTTPNDFHSWAIYPDTNTGTYRYRVEVLKLDDKNNDGIKDGEDIELKEDSWISSLGKPDSTTPHGLEPDAYYKVADGGWARGIVEEVYKISRKNDMFTTYCATEGCKILKMSSIYVDVPFISASASLYDQDPPEEHQAELLQGADCADMVIGVIRHALAKQINYEKAPIDSVEQCIKPGCEEFCYSSADELNKVLSPRGQGAYYKMFVGPDGVEYTNDDYFCEIDAMTNDCIKQVTIPIGSGDSDLHAEDVLLFYADTATENVVHAAIFKADNGDGHLSIGDHLITTSSSRSVAFRDTGFYSSLYIPFRIMRVV